MRVTHARLRRAATLLIGAVLFAVPHPVQAQSREYFVKAEFLERFTRFIDWPSEAFADDTSPFVLCVAGKNPFGTYLEGLVRVRRIHKRRAVLRSVAEPSGVVGCHLLFLAGIASSKAGPFLARAAKRPILTVGESEGLARAGALLNLYIEGTHVRFEVNASAVKSSGLKFSSRLLKLARIVNTEAR
jgi:hypothetical protein